MKGLVEAELKSFSTIDDLTNDYLEKEKLLNIEDLFTSSLSDF